MTDIKQGGPEVKGYDPHKADTMIHVPSPLDPKTTMETKNIDDTPPSFLEVTFTICLPVLTVLTFAALFFGRWEVTAVLLTIVLILAMVEMHSHIAIRTVRKIWSI